MKTQLEKFLFAETCAQWWKSAVVYRVLPDLLGGPAWGGVNQLHLLFQQIEYLDQLQVDAILLPSVHPSQQMSEVVDRAHSRGIRVLLDLVPMQPAADFLNDSSQLPQTDLLLADHNLLRFWLRMGVDGFRTGSTDSSPGSSGRISKQGGKILDPQDDSMGSNLVTADFSVSVLPEGRNPDLLRECLRRAWEVSCAGQVENCWSVSGTAVRLWEKETPWGVSDSERAAARTLALAYVAFLMAIPGAMKIHCGELGAPPNPFLTSGTGCPEIDFSSLTRLGQPEINQPGFTHGILQRMLALRGEYQLAEGSWQVVSGHPDMVCVRTERVLAVINMSRLPRPAGPARRYYFATGEVTEVDGQLWLGPGTTAWVQL